MQTLVKAKHHTHTTRNSRVWLGTLTHSATPAQYVATALVNTGKLCQRPLTVHNNLPMFKCHNPAQLHYFNNYVLPYYHYLLNKLIHVPGPHLVGYKAIVLNGRVYSPLMQANLMYCLTAYYINACPVTFAAGKRQGQTAYFVGLAVLGVCYMAGLTHKQTMYYLGKKAA
jgi:hypothetical protein